MYLWWINNHNNMQRVLVRTYNIRRVNMDAIRGKKLMFRFFWDAILLDDNLPRNRHGNDFLVTSNLQAYALQDKIFSYRTIWPILRFFENCSYISELVTRFLRTVVIYQNWFSETWILLGSLIHPATTELSITPLLRPFTLHPNPHKKAIVWRIKHSLAVIPFCKTHMSGFPCMAGSPTSIVDSVIPFV